MWSDWLVVCDYGLNVSALWCRLTTPTVFLGFLLPWSWCIYSHLLQESAATAPYLGRGVSHQGGPSWPWTWTSSSWPSCIRKQHLVVLKLQICVPTTSKVKSLSRVRLFVTPWTVAHEAPPSMEFSRQEYWSGLPFPSPGDLPVPGIKPGSHTAGRRFTMWATRESSFHKSKR